VNQALLLKATVESHYMNTGILSSGEASKEVRRTGHTRADLCAELPGAARHNTKRNTNNKFPLQLHGTSAKAASQST